MHGILYFDTEDSISPPEAGNDDIVLWIADCLTEHGIIGSFHVIGDKARTLDERGRTDVIEAVKRHDASSHYNHGSVHPTTTELVAPETWDEGVRIAMMIERPGFADIERIFGVCGGLTRHGGSYAPQIIRAAGLCGKPYYGMPFHPPGHRAFWFCGSQVFAGHGLVFDDKNQGSVGHFEPVLPDTKAFEKQLKQFDTVIKDTIKNWNYTSLFGCHPLRMNTTEFACVNYRGGVNRSRLVPPGQRTDHEKRVMKENFVTLSKYLSQVQGLNLVGLSTLSEIFSHTKSEITADELRDYAKEVVNTDDVPLHDFFSPAELLVALAMSIEAHRRRGELPDAIPALNVLGPTQAATSVEVSSMVSAADVPPITDVIVNELLLADRLPSQIDVGDRVLDPATALGVLAHAYLRLADGKAVEDVQLSPRHPYPKFIEGWREAVGNMGTWMTFHPAMDFSNIMELTCLQSWSVKPAYPVAG